jgi:hypothetical protein
VTLLLVVVALVALAAWRYLPVVDAARSLDGRASALAADLRDLGVGDLDRPTIERLDRELRGLESDLVPIRDALGGDPVVGLLRHAPLAGPQVQAADHLVSAADHLVTAADVGLGIGTELVAVREDASTEDGPGLMPGLVRLVSESTDEVDRMAAELEAAQAALAAIGPDAAGPIAAARARIAEPLERYAPVIAEYQAADDVIPSILGWGEPRRYMILAQDPAELRPSGGYTGSVLFVTFQDGKLVDREFLDVIKLDERKGHPFVEPPPELAAHLVGDGSWLLADAGWSPDFPTSAQDALRLYESESGDPDVDGVISLNTYAVDHLLEVLGPVRVAGYETEVQPGEVTLTGLQQTREFQADGSRKTFLDDLATELLERLFSLPAEQWLPMAQKLEVVGRERQAMAWFKDPDAQALMDRIGWSGRVRQDPGDFVLAVDSNVAPSGKLNLVVDRATTLDVALDPDGTATSSLRLDWRNDAGLEGEPYAFLREASLSPEGIYGVWARVLVPAGAELLEASGTAVLPVSGVERVDSESGRTVFGNYLMIRPGTADLAYRWRTPGVVTTDGDEQVYRLTIQKQPGMRSEQVAARIVLPEGATLVGATEGATVDGRTLDYAFDLMQDQVIEVRYRL